MAIKYRFITLHINKISLQAKKKTNKKKHVT